MGWSELPEEIVTSIAVLLDTEEDAARIRAVSSFWRSSIAPPTIKFPLSQPLPGLSDDNNLGLGFKLSASLFYHLKLPASSSSSTASQNGNVGSSSTQRGWLVRVKEMEGGTRIVSNPFGGRIDISPPHFVPDPKELNSLKFRISEVSRSFHLIQQFDIPSLRDSKIVKVILSSRPASTEKDYLVISLTSEGKLLYNKLGEDKWEIMQGLEGSYISHVRADDILEYKDYFYFTGTNQFIGKVDYSCHIVGAGMHPVYCCMQRPCRTYLVKSKEDLLLVCQCCCLRRYPSKIHPPFDVKIFKLVDDERLKWEKVENLDDQVIFICDDCSFSILAKDFPGMIRNCVYFALDFPLDFVDNAVSKAWNAFNIFVFHVEGRSFLPLLGHHDNASMLWSFPCSVWDM
ncbi:hypothetical protein ACFE04_026759 [Oxalis oulophora]